MGPTDEPWPARVGGLGLILPCAGVDGPVSWDRLAATASGAEAAGASAVWALDHLLWHLPMLDCLTALAVAAQHTTGARIGSAVLQLPLRTTASVAKAAASLQGLSGGRLVLGVGTGHHRREFAAAGIPPEGRGRRLDEAIPELRRHWSGEGAHRRYRLAPEPDPIPIWVGGSGPVARRRAAALGDGWIPMALRPDDLRAGVRALAGETAAAGRPAGSVTVGSLLFASVGPDDGRAAAEGTRWLAEFFRIPASVAAAMVVAGPPDRIAAEVGAHREAGADHVVLLVTADDPLPAFGLVAARTA